MRVIWDAAQVMLLFYCAIVVPLRIGFDISLSLWSAGWWWELVVDLFFVTDIFLNFRTGFIAADGKPVMEPKRIARNYLRSWFLVDAVACLPEGAVWPRAL